MYRSNNILSPSKWQRTVRSFLYALLITSLVWIPTEAETAMASAARKDAQNNFICQKQRRSTLCVNNATGIQITIPQQKNRAKIEVVTGEIGDVHEYRDPQDEFEVQQVLTAISFLNSKTGQLIQKFEPAIKIEMSYNHSHVQAVGGAENLKLGFLHKDGYWAEFENVRIRGNNQRGRLSAHITNLENFYSRSTRPIQNNWNSLNNLFEQNQIGHPWGFMSWGG